MISIVTLWLPILLSAVFVFVVSSIIHMFLNYHRNDFGKVSQEDAFMDAVRPLNIPPGDYVVPRAFTNEEMKSEEFKEKSNKGPVIFMTVRPNGIPGVGSSLMQWFMYSILVSIFAAYVTGRALETGAEYMTVFRLATATAFAGYGLALLQNSIWYGRSWTSTLKSVFDAFIYSMVTAGTFGWLWPQ